MHEHRYKLLRGLLALLLIMPLFAQAQSGNWYKVEMLVFGTPGGGSSELFEATPELAYPAQTTFLASRDHPAVSDQQQSGYGAASAVTLPGSELEFRAAASRLQSNGRYQKLFHKAWTQRIVGRSQATPIVLDKSGDGGPWPALQGTIKLYLSRYIYLETNLWLNTDGAYLNSPWRMPPPPLAPPSTTAPNTWAAAQPVASGQVTDNAIGSSEQATGREYPYAHAVLLDQTRRMRSGEVNYLDHPLFGIIVKVTPLAAQQDNPD